MSNPWHYTECKYNTQKKRNSRKKTYEPIFEESNSSTIYWVIGFDAEQGLESKYLRKQLGSKLVQFTNIERNVSTIDEWLQTKSGQHETSELFYGDMFEYLNSSDFITKRIHMRMKYGKRLKIIVHYDGIGFLGPNLLIQLKALSSVNMIDTIIINIQNVNGIRGRRDFESVRDLHVESIKKNYKDVNLTLIKRRARNMEVLNDFTYINQVQTRRVITLAKAA